MRRGPTWSAVWSSVAKYRQAAYLLHMGGGKSHDLSPGILQAL